MKKSLLVLLSILPLYGCSQHAPMATVKHVDIDRFMGDWYVIANIPTFLEKNAFNAIETYEKNDDGSIATTFSFNEGSFTGTRKTYHPTGFIKNRESNALWGMQFIWPIKADYRIVYLDDDYSKTVIGRQSRDYVWVMSRKPELTKEEFDEMVQFIGNLGYDTSKIKRVPQQWPATLKNVTEKMESL